MSIGKNVKRYRENEGLDQTELAERLHITQSMVSHIESGRKIPSVPLLADMAAVLHCTMDELTREKS